MRALTALLIVILAAGVAAQVTVMQPGQMRDTTGTPPPVGTGVMSGAVVSDESAPQPIRRARVSIVNSEGTVTKTSVTDDAGRFSFTALPAGRYSLSATKPGYVRMPYGAKRPDRQGNAVTLANGQNLGGLDMKLPRGGVITGRVLDETGQPAFGTNVRLLQYRMQQGERVLMPAGGGGGLASDFADDRGVYRLYGLTAGEYILSIQPRGVGNAEIRAMTDAEIRAAIQAAQQAVAGGRGTGTGSTVGVPGSAPAATTPPVTPREYTTVGYTPVFYPGTTVATNAAPIVLGAGEERSGVDVQIQLVRTARIEGTVVPPPGIPPQSVTLTMTAVGAASNSGALGLSMINRATPGPDGKFSYTSVQPGQYTISARATQRAEGMAAGQRGGGGAPATFEFTTRVVGVGGGGVEAPMVFAAPGAQGPVFWGTLDVSVDGQNLSNLNITLQPGLTLSGRIQFDGKKLAPPTDLTRTRLNMMPVQTGGGPMIVSGGLPSAIVDQSGKFTITGVVPGRYRIEGNSPMAVGSGWVLKSIVAKGRDVFDFPLEVGPGDEINDAVVTFTDVTQEVSGTLQDPTGRPSPDYTIVVFPSDARMWSSPMSRRIRTARPGTDGRFTVVNLPAGEYRLAALTDIAPGDQTDPAFLQQLVGASIAITLGDGEKKVQDIRIGG